jgi:hypothetical protein
MKLAWRTSIKGQILWQAAYPLAVTDLPWSEFGRTDCFLGELIINVNAPL